MNSFCAHKLSSSPPLFLLLKCLYQVWKLNGYVVVCLGYRFYPFQRLLFIVFWKCYGIFYSSFYYIGITLSFVYQYSFNNKRNPSKTCIVYSVIYTHFCYNIYSASEKNPALCTLVHFKMHMCMICDVKT